MAERIDGVFESLAELSRVVGSVLASDHPSRAGLGGVQAAVLDLAQRHGSLIDGAGVAVAPGLLADADTWLQWWRYKSGGLQFTTHSLNPASVNYYDYTEMAWFKATADSGEPQLTGPYVDFGGTDLKVVTASSPVESRGGVSVAGADLSMAELELLFLRSLGRWDSDVVLFTDSGKVVASNTGRYAAGRIMPDALAEGVRVPFESVARTWRIVVAP
jgi:hypothetical protein